MKFANDRGLDTSRFVPLVPAYQQIVKDHPAHQLGGRHPNAPSKFLRDFAVELHAAGIIIRLKSGTWLADPARLPAAVLLLKTGGTLEPLPPPARPGAQPAPLANLIPNAARSRSAKPQRHGASQTMPPIKPGKRRRKPVRRKHAAPDQATA